MASTGSNGQSTPDLLCQVVTPVGMLGYGFLDEEVTAELERMSQRPAPAAIILDSGSTDSGPGKLALGSMSCPRSSYERDWGKLVKIARKFKVPILISSAGGDGTDEHVNVMLDIIREHAAKPENSAWNLKVISLYSGIKHEIVSERLKAGEIVGCGKFVPPLTQAAIDKTPRIVAQMGPEPFVQAMTENPDFDIIIGGRGYDPAPYIAWCVYNALKKSGGSIYSLGKTALGTFAHMGKLLECGGQCATPKSISAGALIYNDASFDVYPLDPNAKSIPRSVAAHALYENGRPDVLHGPGGHMDLSQAKYEQLADGRSVRVNGTVYRTSQSQGLPYTVKLEGGMMTGFRTLFIGSFIDPILTSQLDTLFSNIKSYVKLQHKDVKETFDIGFHVYGLNDGQKTALDGSSFVSTPGVFVVGEAIAESQELANSVASTARIACIHAPYKDQRATAGNFGFGIGGKFEMEMHECTEFSLYHLMPLKEGEESAISVESYETGKADQGKRTPLFYWTATTIGKNEEPNTDGVNGTNGIHVNGTESGKKKDAPGRRPKIAPTTLTSDNPRVLKDIATVCRSKNAGPFEITVDVLFESPATLELVKSSGLLSREVIARVYNLKDEELVYCGFYDAALAFKATFPRKRNGKPAPAGGFMENDVHTSQQHVPLLMLQLGDDFRQQLKKSSPFS